MNLDVLEKYSLQINCLIVLFLVSFVYKFFTVNNMYLLAISSGVYIYTFYTQIKLISKGFLIRFATNTYVLIDLVIIFLARFNLKYLLFTLITFFLLYLITNITEGIVAVKKLAIFLFFYTLVKLIYIFFLL